MHEATREGMTRAVLIASSVRVAKGEMLDDVGQVRGLNVEGMRMGAQLELDCPRDTSHLKATQPMPAQARQIRLPFGWELGWKLGWEWGWEWGWERGWERG